LAVGNGDHEQENGLRVEDRGYELDDRARRGARRGHVFERDLHRRAREGPIDADCVLRIGIGHLGHSNLDQVARFHLERRELEDDFGHFVDGVSNDDGDLFLDCEAVGVGEAHLEDQARVLYHHGRQKRHRGGHDSVRFLCARRDQGHLHPFGE
jgi:hypothetical protein